MQNWENCKPTYNFLECCICKLSKTSKVSNVLSRVLYFICNVLRTSRSMFLRHQFISCKQPWSHCCSRSTARCFHCFPAYTAQFLQYLIHLMVYSPQTRAQISVYMWKVKSLKEAQEPCHFRALILHETKNQLFWPSCCLSMRHNCVKSEKSWPVNNTFKCCKCSNLRSHRP